MFALPFTITPNAIEKIKEMLASKGLDDSFGLRVGIKGSGCAGTSYILGFDQLKDDDKEFLHDRIRILIAKKDFLYLVGVQIDFIDNNSQRGFTFAIK